MRTSTAIVTVVAAFATLTHAQMEANTTGAFDNSNQSSATTGTYDYVIVDGGVGGMYIC
jgi:hypothetical protein